MTGLKGDESDRAADDYQVTRCDDGSFCCGIGILAFNCCTENNGVFLQNGTAVSRRSSSTIFDMASSSASALIKTTPSSLSNAALTRSQSFGDLTPATAAAAASSSAKPFHQTEAIVGAAIGGAAVLGIISGIIVLIRMRRIKSKSKNQGLPWAAWKDGRDQRNNDTMMRSPFRELATVGPVSELQDSQEAERSELENVEASHRPVQELQS